LVRSIQGFQIVSSTQNSCYLVHKLKKKIHKFLAVFNEKHDKRASSKNKQKTKLKFARMLVPVHDTNTIFIFFIEMQMAKVRKLTWSLHVFYSQLL